MVRDVNDDIKHDKYDDSTNLYPNILCFYYRLLYVILLIHL